MTWKCIREYECQCPKGYGEGCEYYVWVSPFPLPNAEQREVLDCIIEECSEVQKRVTKALRFGLEECQPGQDKNNRQRLGQEIADLYVVVELAKILGCVEDQDIIDGLEPKRRQLRRYLQTQGARQALLSLEPDEDEERKWL